jgi:hypothetical protein
MAAIPASIPDYGKRFKVEREAAVSAKSQYLAASHKLNGSGWFERHALGAHPCDVLVFVTRVGKQDARIP